MRTLKILRLYERIAERVKSGAAMVDYLTLREAADEIERLQTLFGERFHLDAVCSSCGGPLEVERDGICCKCTDGDVADMLRANAEASSAVSVDYRNTVLLVSEFSSLPNLEDRVRAMADDRKRLQAIVDRLPKTADGKTPLPGDLIYYADGFPFVVYSICDSGWEERDECFLHSSEAYSTLEAAKKARTGK